MSAEILAQKIYHRNPAVTNEPDIEVTHRVLHDMESFFWVLVYICLTREGPGGARRGDLSKNEALMMVVYHLFDSPDKENLAESKRSMFAHPDHFEKFVLCHLTKYFEPLRDLLLKWWHLLVLLYRLHGTKKEHDYLERILHELVLHLIEEALGTLPKEEPNQKEVSRRRADIELASGQRVRSIEQNTVWDRTPPHNAATIPLGGPFLSLMTEPQRKRPAPPSPSGPSQARKKAKW